MLSKTEIQSKCWSFIKSVDGVTKASNQRDRAKQAQDFWRGAHWTNEEYSDYKKRGVVPITVNRCRPIVKTIMGVYLNNRQAIRVLPYKNGTATVAAVKTELIKHTEDLSSCDSSVYPELLFRGLLDSESYLTLDVDELQTVNGQPVARVASLDNVDLDPTIEQYDINAKGRFAIERQWKDREWIDLKYPDKTETIKNAPIVTDDPTQRLANFFYDDDVYTRKSDDVDETVFHSFCYRVRTIWWREVIQGFVFGDKQTLEVRTLTDPKDIKYAKKAIKGDERWVGQDIPVYILHKTVMTGSILLEDIENPFGEGVSGLPIFRYCPYWDGGYANGILDDIVPINQEENRMRTEMLRSLEQTTNSGWKVGSDNNKAYTDMLRNFGSVQGLVIPEDKFGGKVEKITPNQMPVGHYQYAQQSELDAKRVAGVDDALQGLNASGSESGRAIDLKRQGNIVSLGLVFNNLYLTLELFGRYLLEVLNSKDLYTDEEIIAIIDDADILDPKIISQAKHQMTTALGGVDLPNPQPMQPLPPETMMSIRPEDMPSVMQTVQDGIKGSQKYMQNFPFLKQGWDDVIKYHAKLALLAELKDNKGRYGVTVSVSPSTPTERITHMMEIDQFSQKYPGVIPPDVMIDNTSLPESTKEQIKTRVAQANQQPAMAGAGV